MMVDLFKKVPEAERTEKHALDFVDFLIKKAIYKFDNKPCTDEHIVGELELYYKDTLKLTKVKQYINETFSKRDKRNFMISEEEINLINYIDVLETKIKDDRKRTEDYLYFELYRSLQDSNKTIDIYSKFAALELINNDIELEVLLYKIYTLLDEIFIKTDKYKERHKVIENINSLYEKYSINYIVKDKLCLNILSIFNISTIEQLKTTKKNILDLLFIFDKDFYLSCNSLSQSLYNLSITVTDEYDRIIEDKETDILKYRLGYATGKVMTLEEVGTIYNITRERIRQIEARANKKLNAIADKKIFILDLIFDCLYNNKMISIKELEKVTNSNIDLDGVEFLELTNDDLYYKLSVIYKTSTNGKWSYNSEYNCLYDKRYDFSGLVDDILSKMPLFLSEIQVSEFDEFQRIAFNNNYKKYHNIYMRKNLMARDIYVYYLKKYFPNGYKNTDENEYNKFKELVINEVGEIEDFPSMRSLSAMFERDGSIILYDRGAVIAVENVPDIPEELLSEIIDFIYESKPSVYYTTIYEKFKYQLQELQINNHYLLKGIIDRKLPEDFSSRRDFIFYGNEVVCPLDMILETIRSYNGIFSLNDLKNKFVGIADYVFFSVLYPEKENGLLFLENKKFIYINKINISDEDKNEIRKVIEDLFTSLNTDTISARKIYARMKLFEDKYNANLKSINSYFDLFSIIQVLFPNEYYYARPLISKNENIAKSREEFLRNHLINFDKFNNNDAKNYLTKMNVGGIYSYLLFMESMSDNFVQIDVDTMVKKEVLDLSEEDLRQIKKLINLLLNNFECIDTRTFNGYSMLPKLKYDWNKYLLVGIIRTYLSDSFNIDNTESTYHKTDFIIRRETNE